MNVVAINVKEKTGFKAAPLRNLTLLDSLMKKTIDRAPHLPGLVTFTGPSGFGKSTAAAHVAAKHQAYYVEMRSTWTKKPFLEVLLRQMGIVPARTIYKMMDQVSEELALSRCPLILDEFDHAVDKNLIEVVRDIYEQTSSPIVIIGEEHLPQKLERWERFHGRILAWGQATPADLADAQSLNRHYEGDIVIKDDLLGMLVTQSKGSVRRIVTNLSNIASFARGEGLQEIGLDQWGKREIVGSRAPAGRVF